MYYLAADPTDVMFTNNLKVCKGIFPSPSFVRAVDDNLKSMVTSYEVMHTDKEKESVFERVRSEHYPNKPSRMGAIYLFQNYETALGANEKWWDNKRDLYETKIQNGSVVLVADSEWLNCTPQDYENNAHNYFQEKTTENSIIEVVVMGVVEVAAEPKNA
jgi:hypothetical protein